MTNPLVSFGALIYANQLDSRIELTQANEETWMYALKDYPGEQLRTVIRDYYAHDVTGNKIPLGYIRQAVQRNREIAAARKRARQLPAPVEARDQSEMVETVQTTPEFIRAFTQGKLGHLQRLEERGVINAEHQAELDHYREHREFPRPSKEEPGRLRWR